MSRAIVQGIRPEGPAQPPAEINTPADLVRHAVASGANVERLQALMDMQLKWEANEARKAYVAAMAEFKRRPLAISKDKLVSFTTSKGLTEYRHATLGNVVEVVVPALAEFGFSHNWEVKQSGDMIQVTCVLTHSQGHSERVSLFAGRDESGSKNAIQSVASAVTYLQRYTLLAICGLGTRDQADPDGRETVEATITDVQAQELRDAMAATNANEAKFLAHLGVDSLDALPSQRFKEAMAILVERKKKQEASRAS